MRAFIKNRGVIDIRAETNCSLLISKTQGQKQTINKHTRVETNYALISKTLKAFPHIEHLRHYFTMKYIIILPSSKVKIRGNLPYVQNSITLEEEIRATCYWILEETFLMCRIVLHQRKKLEQLAIGYWKEECMTFGLQDSFGATSLLGKGFPLAPLLGTLAPLLFPISSQPLILALKDAAQKGYSLLYKRLYPHSLLYQP